MLLRAVLATAAGLSLWLAHPGFDHWWLAPIGVAAMALACVGSGGRRGALLGLLTGLACFLPLLHWSGIFVGSLPWVALSISQAMFVAALGALVGWWGGRGTPRQVPVPVAVVALGWVVLETGRSSWPYGGFGWGRLGFSQADSPLLGFASVLGVPGVSLLVALIGALLARAAQTWNRSQPRALAALACAVALLLSPALIPRPVDGPGLSVLGIQGNVPQLGLDFNAQRRAVLDNHAQTTLDAAARVASGELPAPDLVVWPENSSDIDPLRHADAYEVIDAAVAAIDAPVVVGTVLRTENNEPSNVSLLWTPEEGVVDRYVKQRPVPFAEYIPHRSFYRLFSPYVDPLTDFVAGDEVGVMDVPTAAAGTVPIGVGICFEIILDPVMRDTVLGGAQILVVPTNNATFGISDESVQQLSASRLKAVELGRSVVHVSTVGVSALITPDGHPHQQTELFTRAILSGELPLRTDLTIATRLGSWPEILMATALGGLLLVRLTAPAVVRVKPVQGTRGEAEHERRA